MGPKTDTQRTTVSRNVEGHAISSVASVLLQSKSQSKESPKGLIQFCFTNHEIASEVTVDAGEEFPVNPQIKGALKSLEGVLQVEDI